MKNVFDAQQRFVSEHKERNQHEVRPLVKFNFLTTQSKYDS